MLSPPKPRRLDEPIAVSLEGLVPRDHFYRHLEAKLDLSFVRDWTRALYAERGRPSIDPVVFCKLQLVMFEAKAWHGLRRLRLRGLMNANIQGLLIAAGQNLKRFLVARGWGRRNAPCGSLLALPSEPGRLSAVCG
jgi:hypothetical protein